MTQTYEYGGITFGVAPVATRKTVTTYDHITGRRRGTQTHRGYGVRVTYRDPETGKPVIERPGWFFQKPARAVEAGKRLARDIVRGR